MSASVPTPTPTQCPCDTGRRYGECCGPIHAEGARLGSTAEALMRARYSAYVMCDESFLLESWHVDTRPPAVVFDPDISWHGLTVIDTESGGVFDAAGEVAFIARFDRGGEPLQLEERSSFVRVESRWMYVTGE